jgi:hypothetical protein
MEQNNNKRMQLKNSRKGSLDWNAETFAGIHPQNILKKMLLFRFNNTSRLCSKYSIVVSQMREVSENFQKLDLMIYICP